MVIFLLIYRTNDGIVLAKIPEGQPYEYLHEEDVSTLVLEDYPINVFNYKVVGGSLVKLTNTEIDEIREYSRILDEDERLINSGLDKLKPSSGEIKKAETTIEILSLLSEVL